MGACDRIRELAPQLEIVQGPKAQEMWREYVNAWLECNNHPEALTTNSAEIRALAVEIVGRFKNPAITVDDTDLQIGWLIAGRESPSAELPKCSISRSADPVTTFNGQFVYEVQDVRIAGAGIDFVFTRTYKSQMRFPSPLGFNWNHSYNHALRVAQQTIFRSTGDLRVDAYVRHPKFGQSGFDYWLPPDGQDSVIVARADSFVWRAPNGVRHFFEQDGGPFLHRLARIEDRNGNYLALDYTENRLWRVRINHPQRFVTFRYDEQNRIVAMMDFTGREWSYRYDDYGDLVSVNGPATDEYPAGLTVCYEYSSAQFGGELQHNLCRIIDPAGNVFLENEYGTALGLLSFNRVMRQRQGGGEYTFEYADLPPEGDLDYSDEERPAHQTIRVERNGQPICQVFNRFGQVIAETQRVLKNGVLQTLTSRYRYNRDGALLGSLTPEGVVAQNLYGREYFTRRHGLETDGSASTEALTLDERQAFGRLLATVKRARRYDFSEMDLARGVWGDFFPDIIEAFDDDDAVAKFIYEPIYGQVLTASDPRFTRTPDPAVQTAAAGEHPRYEETLVRHDYQGPAANPGSDPTRLLKEIRHPTPTLPDGTAGAPVMHHYVEYDDRGRLLRSFDAAGVEMVTEYFGPVDGVREGFPKRTIVDPGGLALTTEFEIDMLGRTVAVHLPRSVDAPPGRFVTRTAYNALDQVVTTMQSAPFGFTVRQFYDRSGKLVRQERDAKDETGVDLAGAPEIKTLEYDDEQNLITESAGGRDIARHLVKRHRYDRAGNRILTVLPEGNRIRYRYDERQLLVAQITGADTANAATTRTEYDGDGRVCAVIDARGNRSTLTCDPFGRVIASEDPLGNVIRRDYDKLDQLRVKRVFEKRADGYYLLARNTIDYDELGHEIRHAADRFKDAPGPLSKADLPMAFLTTPVPSAQVLVGTIFRDVIGRPVRTVDALSRQTLYEYDALDRVVVVVDPMGNRVESQYDAHGNVVRRDVIDVVRDLDDPAVVISQRVFSTTSTFDELDRIVTRSDSAGNVTRLRYDSRGLTVYREDPLGNVSRIEHDIHGRRVRQRCELTTTGLGDSAVESVLEERFEYDRNGNLVRAIDALGRVMTYGYDALDRGCSVTYPDGSTATTAFDKDGHVVHRRDCNGLQRRYTVDALGRATRVDVDASEATAGEIGGATFERYAYDALNRRCREENDFAAYEMRYDSLDSVFSEQLTFAAAGAPVSGPFVIERTFDDVGSVRELRYPNGRQLRHYRDDLNRLTRIANVENGSDYPGSAGLPEAYDIATFAFAGRQRVRRRHGNGTTCTYAHDSAGRLVEVDHAAASGSMLKLQYLWDGVNNIRVRHEITDGVTRSESFAYDSLRRLTDQRAGGAVPFNPVPLGPATVVLPDPLPRHQDTLDALIGTLDLPPPPHTYDYDLVGNRRVARNVSTVEYTINALDQYTEVADPTTSIALRYDLNGNLRAAGARGYVYDSCDRLVNVTEGGVTIAEFFHDTRGRRVMERGADTTLQIVWDGDHPIEEYREGTLTAQYVNAGGADTLVQIAARVAPPSGPGAEHWFHTDLAGSVRLLTTRNGTPAASYAYEPFGEARGSVANSPYNPFRYAGGRLDSTLQTYNCRARQYDPALGRFQQRDPGGSPDGSNLYAYATNAPLALNDPLGMQARPEVTRAAAAEAYFKPYWERLDKAEEKFIYRHTAAVPKEDVPRNRERVKKVFGAYRAILKEIQDATIADRDIDIKELWNQEHEYKDWSWKDTSWMYLCNRCYENPSLMDVGPFGGQKVSGIDVARVFRIVTGNEQPNPSLSVRIVRSLVEIVMVFGPDIAVGVEASFLRKAAIREGMATAKVRFTPLPFSEAEFYRTWPGDSIAMGTYGGGYEVYLRHEASQLGYRSLGASPHYAAELGIVPPVPNAVRNLGDEAIVEHEVQMYLKPAPRIGFWLTGREHEFPTSITTMELNRHMDDPELFNKTQFYINPLAVDEVDNFIPTPGVVDVPR